MKTRTLLLPLALLVTACPPCPPPQTGPGTSPYVIAKGVIYSGQLAVSLAGGFFNLWLSSRPATTPAEKISEYKTTYNKVSTSVLNGLQLALTAVNIAEEQGKEFNLVSLLAQAETAWQQLRQFLSGLGVNVPATSLPKVSKPEAPVFNMSDLPVTLLPKKGK